MVIFDMQTILFANKPRKMGFYRVKHHKAMSLRNKKRLLVTCSDRKAHGLQPMGFKMA
jgi:hypothetical protein